MIPIHPPPRPGHALLSYTDDILALVPRHLPRTARVLEMQDNDLQGVGDGLGLRAGDGLRTPDNQVNSGGPSRNDATTSRVKATEGGDETSAGRAGNRRRRGSAG